MRIIAVVIVTLLMTLAGCAGTAAWKPVDEKRARYTGSLGVSADLPAGWLMVEDRGARMLLLTRHSVPMEFIQIRRHKLSEPLPYTDLTLSAGMKNYEAAEIVTNNLRATPGVFDLTVEEIAPALIGGKDGFELLVTYAMENGMRRRCLVYGVIADDKYYAEAALYALEDHYFDAALKDFLALVESIKIRNQ